MTKIFVSSIIKAPIIKVWDIVRDFNDMPNWHPLIKKSMIEDGKSSDCVGCVRNFYLNDNTHIREQLLMLSDFEFSFSYAIIESQLEVDNYVASLNLTPVTDGNQTFCVWSAEFDTKPEMEIEMSQNISQNVFQAGFNALKDKLEGKNYNTK